MSEVDNNTAERDPARIEQSRLLNFVCSEWDIIDILSGKRRITNLPADARVMRWAFDYRTNGIGIIIHSASFAPVPPAYEIPLFLAVSEYTEKQK